MAMRCPLDIQCYRNWFALLGALFLVACLFLGSGCRVITGTRTPKPQVAVVRGIEGGEKPRRRSGNQLTLEELQVLNMSIADGFLLAMSNACDDMRDNMTNITDAAYASRWKSSHGTIVTVLASGSNPAIAMVDLAGTLTLGRMLLEDYWIPEVFGDNGQELLRVHRQHETNIWNLVRQVTTEEQQNNLRLTIEDWRRDNPTQRFASYISISEYVKGRAQNPLTQQQRTANLLSIFRLNPLSNLDPATAAIQETRQFAERSMYYFQRLPALLQWQTEVLYLELNDAQPTRDWMNQIQGFREAADRLVTVADQLPDRLSDAQVNVIRQVGQESATLVNLVTNFHKSFQAGEQMAQSIDKATRTLNSFVKQFERDPNSTARPFDIREYGATADQIAQAAGELNRAISTFNDLMETEAWKSRQEEVSQVIGEAQTSSEKLLDRTFSSGLKLILVFLAGLFLVLLLYRFIATRWLREQTSRES